MQPDRVLQALKPAGPAQAACTEPSASGVHVDAIFAPDRIRAAVQALRDAGFLIEDVLAVDAAPELLVLYHFLHPQGGCRAALRVLTDRSNPSVPTIQDIYPGANWHERETHDMYGVVFEGHPDLSPLLLPEDAGDFHPLRKPDGGLKSLADLFPQPEAEAGEEQTAPDAPAGDGGGES